MTTDKAGVSAALRGAFVMTPPGVGRRGVEPAQRGDGVPDVESRIVKSGGPPANLFTLADVEQDRRRRSRQRVGIADRPEHAAPASAHSGSVSRPSVVTDGPAVRQRHHRARATAADAIGVRLQHQIAGGDVMRHVIRRQPSGGEEPVGEATDACDDQRTTRPSRCPRRAARRGNQT